MCNKSRIDLQIFFFCLICLCCFGLILINIFNEQKHIPLIKKISVTNGANSCYYKQENIAGLLDDILDAKIQPKPGGSIFFHETSCRKPPDPRSDRNNPIHLNLANLTVRQACAVESAALHNPNSTIFVLYASPVSWFNGSSNKFMNAILSYSNVHLRNLDMWRYTVDTPIYDWFRSDKLFKSRYALNNISNILRLLTLWRYGGTYLDLDVLVLRSLEVLPSNYAGAESTILVNNAVLNLSPVGLGRKFAEYSLQDFQTNFNGSKWGHNGPCVITRTLKHFCQTNVTKDMFDTKRCLGFKVFERDAFYPIVPTQWKKFFNESQATKTLEYVQKKGSYLIHVWNYLSKKQKHLIGTPGAYGELASKNCPKVYASAEKYF